MYKTEKNKINKKNAAAIKPDPFYLFNPPPSFN